MMSQKKSNLVSSNSLVCDGLHNLFNETNEALKLVFNFITELVSWPHGISSIGMPDFCRIRLTLHAKYEL